MRNNYFTDLKNSLQKYCNCITRTIFAAQIENKQCTNYAERL